MLSRADSYLDDALKLDCDERGDGSWGLSGPASNSPSTAEDALLNTFLMMSPRRSSVAAMDSTASTDFSSMDSATTAASTTMHSAA